MEFKDIKSHGYLFFAEENGRLVAEDEGGKPYFPDRKTNIHAGLVEVWEIKDKGNYAFVTGENVKTSRIPSADEIARTVYENNLDIASEAVSFDGWPIFSMKSEASNAFICFEGKVMRIGSVIRKGYRKMNYILSIFDADRSKKYGILEACNRLAVNYAQELNTDDIIPDLVPCISYYMDRVYLLDKKVICFTKVVRSWEVPRGNRTLRNGDDLKDAVDAVIRVSDKWEHIPVPEKYEVKEDITDKVVGFLVENHISCESFASLGQPVSSREIGPLGERVSVLFFNSKQFSPLIYEKGKEIVDSSWDEFEALKKRSFASANARNIGELRKGFMYKEHILMKLKDVL